MKAVAHSARPPPASTQKNPLPAPEAITWAHMVSAGMASISRSRCSTSSMLSGLPSTISRES